MQNCSLTSLPFHPFTHRGPIVFVLIKQLLARMCFTHRDLYTLVPACTPTCYFTCYVHAYARTSDHSPRDCTANLHLTAIKNSLRTRQGNSEARGHRRNEERQKKPQGRIEALYSVHVEQSYFLFYGFIQRCTCGECGTSG